MRSTPLNFLILLLTTTTTLSYLLPPSPRPHTRLKTTASESDSRCWSDVDAKQKACLFGRLADKYILLDSSGGSCCYSGCTDCEFRDEVRPSVGCVDKRKRGYPIGVDCAKAYMFRNALLFDISMR